MEDDVYFKFFALLFFGLPLFLVFPLSYSNIQFAFCVYQTFPPLLYDLLEQCLPFYNFLKRRLKRSFSILSSPLPPPSLPVPENEKLLAWVGDELLPCDSAKVYPCFLDIVCYFHLLWILFILFLKVIFSLHLSLFSLNIKRSTMIDLGNKIFTK